MKNKIPFYRQDWWVEDFESYGFDNMESCQYWKESSCGILCLKMAYEYYGGEIKKIADYVDMGLEMRAYSHDRGWSHLGLVEMAEELGLNAYLFENEDVEFLRRKVGRGALGIVSVKTGFCKKSNWREQVFFWKKYGGHLCLVTGVKKEGVVVNHTSIDPELNWRERLIDEKMFADGFAGRGLVLFK